MKQVFLATVPTGAVTPAHFSVREVPVPFRDEDGGFDQSKMESDHIVVKVTAMSVDPYMRSRMGGEGPGYLTAWAAGQTIESHCVGMVMASRCSKFPNGTMVLGMMPWNEFCLLDGSANFPIGPMELPKVEGLAGKETLFLGAFGIPGLTAAIGLKVKGKLTKGAVVVVSGAAGATGSVVGQIARIREASKIVGICGTDEKCAFLKEECGYTHTINYKTDNVAEKLSEYCGNSVNCYWDNVGGVLSETVIGHMAPNSDIVICGQISSYNNRSIPYPNPLSEPIQSFVDTNKITRERFLITEWMKEYQSCLQELIQWYCQGKIVARETFTEGIENAGVAFCDMMNGQNIGKMVVRN